MAKWRKPRKTSAAENVAPTKRPFQLGAVISLAAILCMHVGIAAHGADTVLKGHVTGGANSSIVRPAQHQQEDSNLVDRYGAAALSPTVSDAIRKAEKQKSPEWLAGAKAVADKHEALAHGHILPGTNPIGMLMYGHIPPGMPPQQAAALYQALPHLPQMPGAMTPEMVSRMAGEPADPDEGLLQAQGLSRNQVEAANQKMFEDYMRKRFGPIYVAPLHRDPGWLALHAQRAANGFTVKKDNQLSPIVSIYEYARPNSIREMTDQSGNIMSQFTYDPYGVATQIAGSGPVPDFGYSHYYVHQRSGLLLTRTRPYSPILGRFITRDPIGESGGTNLYAYAGNSPVNFTDPMGTFVQATYSLSNGTFVAQDSDTGQTFVGNAFSGQPGFQGPGIGEFIPYMGPIPEGSYGMGTGSFMPSESNVPWIPLTPLDPSAGMYRPGTGIHPGTISRGCVTFPSSVAPGQPGYPQSSPYNNIQQMINNTSPGNIGGTYYQGILQVIP